MGDQTTMRTKYIAIIFVLSLSVFFAACGGGTTPTPNANNANTASANGNSNNPLETKKATPETTTNNAPTLMPVYKAYCDAIAKKDEAAIRKMYSADTIKFFEEQMKLDKVKTLREYLDVEQGAGKICEVRNETITGDRAVAEIRGDSYPNGIKIVFLKENGEWKLTNQSPDIDSVKQSSTNSNTAK